MDKPIEKITVNCEHCKGSGMLKDGICISCSGRGYNMIEKETYYRQLRRGLKHRLEKEK